MPPTTSTPADRPRVHLAPLPTPLEPLPRLGERLGVADLWVKRDDLTALGTGGNKVRKLEFLLGDALARDCDTVVTFGALQSNHARQTAAACARVGLRCELVLTRAVPLTGPAYECSGNLLLDELFGATVHVVAHDDAALATATESVRVAVEGRGGRARWVPPGGSDAVGTLGYVSAGLELAAQAAASGVDLTDVVLADSTGGTHAGLLVGLRLGGCDAAVHGMAVYRDARRTAGAVAGLVRDVAALVGTDPVPDEEVLVDDSHLGDGYGRPTAAMWEALSTWGRTEGIALDPVYSGKAAAGLAALAAAGAFGDRGSVAFLHTGGTPGLFAYADRLPRWTTGASSLR